MVDDGLRAEVCASLSRADATGRDLCFIKTNVMERIHKEFTPRILELGDIPHWQGAVWIEWRDHPDQVEAMLYRYEQRPFFRFSGKDHPFGIDLGTSGYGKDWRAWTLPVSETERREEPWDGKS